MKIRSQLGLVVLGGALAAACGSGGRSSAPPSPDATGDAGELDAVDADRDPAESDAVDAADTASGDADRDSEVAPDADSDPDTPDVGPELDAPRFRPAAGSGATVVIVAHQDDELLFITPDITRAVRSGRPYRAIYVTAGDGCFTRDSLARDAGARAAITRLWSGTPEPEGWSCAEVSIAGVAARECGHPTAPISAVNLQLPDCEPALLELGTGVVGALAQRRPERNEVTEAQVVAALREELSVASTVLTLDASGVYGHDNTDHEQTARWVFDAAAGLDVELREHRSYNTDTEPLNVTPEDLAETWAAVVDYCDLSAEGDDICRGESGVAFYEWARRQIVDPVLRPGPGVLALRSNAGCVVDAEGLWAIGPCDAAALPVAIGPRGVALGGVLVGEGVDGVAVPDGVTTLRLMQNGQLRSAPGRCAGPLEVDGWRVAPCEPAADEARVAPAQRWWLSLAGTILESASLSDDEVGSDRRSFGLLYDGSSYRACVRAADGLRCAPLDEHGAAGPSTLMSAELADAEGWAPTARDATVRFGDLDGDGDDDVCARGARGLLCALLTDGEFEPAGVYSSGDDFSDAQDDEWFSQDRFGSIQLVDFDVDGRADVCARVREGVACARNEGGEFGPLTLGFTTDLRDDGGWNEPSLGATLRFGDVDGDGRPDLCARSYVGVFCAPGAGDGTFGTFRYWGTHPDLEFDAAWVGLESYWSTLALVDYDRDGRADVCVRSPAGLLCGHSNGYHFGPLHQVGPFEDDDGFDSEAHGGSLRWASRAGGPICARSERGVRCLVR
ncbi:MAG: VCBS repeat-containing protein [Myxococcales bacterium]|nr:VCBS repeat-containing protein [Myxococcales bacterium]